MIYLLFSVRKELKYFYYLSKLFRPYFNNVYLRIQTEKTLFDILIRKECTSLNIQLSAFFRFEPGKRTNYV